MGVRAIIFSAVALALGAFIYLAVFVQGAGPNNTFGPSLHILESVVGTSGLILMIVGALGIGVSATTFTLSRISSHRARRPVGDVAQEVQIVR
jgi:hypothetical protein